MSIETNCTPKGCAAVKECICKNTDCENYRKCCACVASHREREYLPACLRKEEPGA